MKKLSNRFSNSQVLDAFRYWRDGLTLQNITFYWRHYTTGSGSGMYSNLCPDTTLSDYLVITMYQSEHEKALDI